MAGNQDIMALTFRVFRGSELVLTTELAEANISIGRAENAVLRVDDPSLGDLHAVINIAEGRVTLHDLGHGFRFGDREVLNEEVSLSSGDAFQLGDIRFEVAFGEELPADPPTDEQPAATPAPVATPAVSAATGVDDDDEEVEEEIEDVVAFIMRSGSSQSTYGVDTKRPRVLEVNQMWGNTLLDTRHYPRKGKTVTVGASVDYKWHFIGVDVGWVPEGAAKILPYIPPVWSEITTEWRNDFYVPDTSLPGGAGYELLKWEGDRYVARISTSWDGFAEVGEKRYSFDELVTAGLATKEGVSYVVPMSDELRLLVDIQGVLFFVHMVYPGTKVLARLAENVDYPFLGIFSFVSFVGLLFGVVMHFSTPPAANEIVELPDHFVKLLLEKPEPEKIDSKKPAANPDAGEGAKAKREEGKVGKKDAKMEKAKGNKREVRKTEQDRRIAENAGVLGALNDAGDMGGVFGSSGLSSELTGGIGGLIGAKGTQIGSGGLGSRGSGLGGGGTAEGLGGLGTKGIGSGSSGFGSGGGNFGAKGEGAISRVGGDPIILGALDRSLIDEVVKRHMNQIRYCYQRELTKDPTLGGKVVIKFTISRDGSVSAASVKTTTLNNSPAEECIVSRFYRMQFPEPKGGGVVIVSYPFLFAPG